MVKMGKLDRSFYRRSAATVAHDLVGKILVRRLPRGKLLRARIVETEAYVGAHDLACHAAKGRTTRTEVMFGDGGHAYVYFIYGMYDMFNIVTGAAGDAQAVLVRAAEPLNGWDADLSGPGKLCRAMCITRALNGANLVSGDQLFLTHDTASSRRKSLRVVRTVRIGVDYAKHWKDELLRFVDADSPAVSHPKLHRTSKS
jgi:DNA-3-methyladenine glycosylase